MNENSDRGRPVARDRMKKARRALAMRERGSTWHEVGKVLRMTRQGARQLVERAREAGDVG